MKIPQDGTASFSHSEKDSDRVFLNGSYIKRNLKLHSPWVPTVDLTSLNKTWQFNRFLAPDDTTIHFYRPQTKFGARQYFQKHVSRILSTGVCLVRGVSATGGGCLLPGGVPGPGGRGSAPGGCLVETPRTATAVGGTHPTGMHCCQFCDGNKCACKFYIR